MQDLVVLREALAETDAGVEDDLRFRDTGFACNVDGTAQASQDVFHHIASERPLLHGARFAAQVHQNKRNAMTRGDFGNARIAFQGGDVIDDFRAGVERGLRDFGFLRVNGNGNFQESAQAAEHGEEPSPFFLRGNSFGTRPCGLGADVDQVGAGARHLQGVLDCMFLVVKFAAVGKTVRRHVQDAHDESPLAKDQSARWEFEAEEFAADHWQKLV